MHFALRCISSHKAGAGMSDTKRKMIIGGVVAAAFAAVVGVAFVCMGANNVGGGIPKPPMHVHDEDEASTGIHSGSLNESGSETVSGLDDAGKTKGSDGSEACIPSEVSSSQPLSAGESGETDNVVDFGSLDPGQADPSGQGAASSDNNQEPPNSSDNPSGDAPSGEQWTGYY